MWCKCTANAMQMPCCKCNAMPMQRKRHAMQMPFNANAMQCKRHAIQLPCKCYAQAMQWKCHANEMQNVANADTMQTQCNTMQHNKTQDLYPTISDSLPVLLSDGQAPFSIFTILYIDPILPDVWSNSIELHLTREHLWVYDHKLWTMPVDKLPFGLKVAVNI